MKITVQYTREDISQILESKALRDIGFSSPVPKADVHVETLRTYNLQDMEVEITFSLPEEPANAS